MKNIFFAICLSLFSTLSFSQSNLTYKLNAEQIAMNYARGVYSLMDRDALKVNPNAKIDIYLRETHASAPGQEIYKAIRVVTVNNVEISRCGTSLWMDKGTPSLEADLYCSN